MSEENLDFATALAHARQRGFAEADPSLDVDGHDAAQKLAILAAVAFRARVPCEAVFRQGITDLQLQDILFARKLGYVVKLLGQAQLVEMDGTIHIDARVHPVLIPRNHALASVRDEYNAVMVDADFLGSSLYQGKGAGAHPSASAVVTDIVSLARRLATPQHNYRSLCSRALPILPMDDVACRYYVRCQVANRPGVLHAIAGAFSQYGVGIATVTQEGCQKRDRERHQSGNVPLVITTHRTREGDLQSALAAVRATSIAAVTEAILLRVLDDVPETRPARSSAVSEAGTAAA